MLYNYTSGTWLWYYKWPGYIFYNNTSDYVTFVSCQNIYDLNLVMDHPRLFIGHALLILTGTVKNTTNRNSVNCKFLNLKKIDQQNIN
jgi:hypothetical protein